MAIKRIQLRGISRTPSDRLTDDGGCAESLNVQLDNTEIAPSFMPEDKTLAMGLPEGLQAERVFVHKTQSYENYIVVQSNKVLAYTPSMDEKGPLSVLELADDESVNDIISVGNTLAISSSKNMYYILFKDREYKYLGNKVPFPNLLFEASRPREENISIEKLDGHGAWFEETNLPPSESDWNEDYNEGLYQHTNNAISRFHSDVWSEIDKKAAELLEEDYFLGNIFVRYAIRLYDGSLLSSMPLFYGFSSKPIDCKLRVVREYRREQTEEAITYDNHADITLQFYKLYAKLESFEIDEWLDIIEGIDIYISQYPTYPFNREMSKRGEESASTESINSNWYITTYSYPITLGDKRDNEVVPRLIQASAETYLVNQSPLNKPDEAYVKTFDWEGLSMSLNDLIAGGHLRFRALAKLPLGSTSILTKDDMKHYVLSPERFASYNNRLILINPAQAITYDYQRLNSLVVTEGTIASGNSTRTEYEVTYVLAGQTRDLVVKKEGFYSFHNENDHAKYLAFQIFPDSRAYKMIVKATMYKNSESPTIRYGEFDMTPHPLLDCAYFYEGPVELSSLCTLITPPAYSGNNIDDAEHKLLVSKIDDPFTFPNENRFTFQSKVVGVAIATTTLSQGQFGQFPLYVFTEDGIWVMETSSNGSFVSVKPGPRDVCVNPDSIISIDNAVVFVSTKGVMLMQGSQVVNISPFMNGKHYVVDDYAAKIIEGQDYFGELLPSITDKTHFLAFVKNASVAYDYAGQRLIFIKKDETYQYIYKLDTQTWHKTAYGIDLVAPINSYPECLVQARKDSIRRFLYSNRPDNQITPTELANLTARLKLFLPNITETEVKAYLNGEPAIDVTDLSEEDYEWVIEELDEGWETGATLKEMTVPTSRIYDLSTILDAAESQVQTRGVIATRPFDLDAPDILKTITDIRIRGQYAKGAVKFILQGSNDGIRFQTINTLRGKAWKLFRIIILSNLYPTERISWIDVQYETRFADKLR